MNLKERVAKLKKEIDFYQECYLVWNEEMRLHHTEACHGFINNLSNLFSLKLDNPSEVEQGEENSSNSTEKRNFFLKWIKSIRGYSIQRKKLDEALSKKQQISLIGLSLARTNIMTSLNYRRILKDLVRSFDENNRSSIIENAIDHEALVIIDASHTSLLEKDISLGNEDSIYFLNSFLILTYFFKFSIFHPLSSINFLFVTCLSLPKLFKRSNQFSLKHLLSIYLCTFTFSKLFSSSQNLKVFNFTGNSIVTDALRFFGLQDENTDHVCDVLHGVNHPILDNYHRKIDKLARHYFKTSNLSFVNYIPDMPQNGIPSKKLLESGDPIINIYFNLFLNHYEFQQKILTQNILTFLSRLYCNRRDSFLIIGLIGSNDPIYKTSKGIWFELEKNFISKITQIAKDNSIKVKIIYSPHPSVDKTILQKDELLKENKIIFFNSTMKLNLFSDISFALLSGAIFEAGYFGSVPYSPITKYTKYWSKEVLDLLHHPSENSVDSIKESLTIWLKSVNSLTLDERKSLINKRLNMFKNWGPYEDKFRENEVIIKKNLVFNDSCSKS